MLALGSESTSTTTFSAVLDRGRTIFVTRISDLEQMLVVAEGIP